MTNINEIIPRKVYYCEVENSKTKQLRYIFLNNDSNTEINSCWRLDSSEIKLPSNWVVNWFEEPTEEQTAELVLDAFLKKQKQW